MRLVIISDTHEQLNKLTLPEGDVLIHCGDATNLGSINEFHKFKQDMWCQRKRYRHILYIPGNHDFLAEKNYRLAKSILGGHIKMLVDETIEIDGVLFYGSPWQPRFMGWAFNLYPEELKRKWSFIPNDVEVLLTHTPKYGMLDLVGKRNVGCLDLTTRMQNLKKLKLHAFGHIHECGQRIVKDKILNVNASILDENHNCTGKAIVIDKIGNNYVPINIEVENVEIEEINLKKAREESKKITANGITRSVKEWADFLGYKETSLRNKLTQMDVEDILDERNL